MTGIPLFAITCYFSVQAMAASAVTYPDHELANVAPKIKARLLKMRGVLERKPACVVAIYQSSDKLLSMNHDQFLPKTVDCIGDFVSGEGSLNEKTGCSLVKYNMDNAQYAPYLKLRDTPMSSKPCGSGGFEELMSGNLKPDLFSILSNGGSPWRYILVFANGENYLKLFTAARKSGLEAAAQKQKRKIEKENAAEEEQLQTENEENAKEAARKKKVQQDRDTKEALWK